MILKPLKRIKSPGRLVAWDTEAKQAYKGEPINTEWLGGGVTDDGENVIVERNEHKFFSELMKPRYKGAWLYAHNGTGYDFQFLLRWMACVGVPWTGYCTGSRIFIRAADRHFMDSACVLRGSLDKMAKTLGVRSKKQAVPVDFYERIEAYDWVSYLEDDCRALYQCLETLRGAFGRLGGTLRPTLASSALALWRYKYLDTEIQTPDPWDPLVAAQRSAYVGGRCEKILGRLENGVSYDINSSYPASMIEAPVPCELLGTGNGETKEILSICDATIDIPHDDLFPVVCQKSRDGRLWWVTGKRRGWYTGIELARCRELYGSSSVVMHAHQIFRGRNLFDGFVHDLYSVKKRAGSGGLYLASKFAMNGLYGKYGQRREREKIVSGVKYVDWPLSHPLEAIQLERYGISARKRVIDAENHLYSIPTIDMHSTHIMPVLAATITARSRIRMEKALRAAGQRACYGDTDSVYVSGDSPVTGMDIGRDLGQWSMENAIIEAEFAAPKVYWYRTEKGTSARAKGLRKRDVETVRRFIAGESVKIGRVMGLFEARARTGEWGLKSEVQEKQRRNFQPRRHEDGTCFSMDDLERLGIL